MNRREFLASIGILGIGAFMPSHEQQHYWTGSEWLKGDVMQVPEAGETRLLTVATESGWRVELGEPAYPIRYWDGTDSVFTVNDSGDIVARSITLYPVSGGMAGVVTVNAASAGNDVHAFSFIDNTGGERWYIRAGAGEMRTNSTIETYAALTDAAPLFRVTAGGSLEWGAGGASAPDVLLYRSAAGVLALNTGNSLAWTGATTSRLDSSGYIQLVEQTAPSAPAANQVRLYSDDNGAGKTRLMALFSSGAAQQVAIQP